LGLAPAIWRALLGEKSDEVLMVIQYRQAPQVCPMESVQRLGQTEAGVQ